MRLRKPRKHQLLPGIRREPYCRELREFLKKKHKKNQLPGIRRESYCRELTRILKKKHTEKKTSYLVHDESLIAGYYELVRVGVVVVYGLERSL